MNISHSATVAQAGVYLLSQEKPITISLQNFLVITFHSPSSASTGVVLQTAIEHRKDFLDELDQIREKYMSLADVDANLIQCKLFGSGDKFSSLITTLKTWLQRNEIPLVASQLGKNLPTELILESRTGKVGMQIPHHPSNDEATFLSVGTARNRNQGPAANKKFLVLSSNPVTRTLAKQSIEEEQTWEAFTPARFSSSEVKAVLIQNAWSVVVLSDEMKKNVEVLALVASHIKKNPGTGLAWIGGQIPDLNWDLPSPKLLPPLEPYLISQFKKVLRQTLSESFLQLTNETLAFKKKSRKG